MVDRWTVAGAVAVYLAAAHATPAAETVSAEQVAAAVARLGDGRFEVREEANAFLWRAGAPARAALEAATGSDDPEVAVRAKDILWRLQHGIVPGMPPEVVSLMYRYRDDPPENRRDVLEQLIDRDAVENAVALLEGDPWAGQENLKHEYLRGLSGEAVDAIIYGRLDRAERLLAFAARCDGQHALQRDYAAVLLGRGRLEAKIEALQVAGAGSRWRHGISSRATRASNGSGSRPPSIGSRVAMRSATRPRRSSWRWRGRSPTRGGCAPRPC